MAFAIRHETRYRFPQPVQLHPHRLMIRPRDSHDLRLIDAALTVSPPAPVTWSFDVFGNSIGTVRFDQTTDTISFVSEIKIERYAVPPLELDSDLAATAFPPNYTVEDRRDLAGLLLVEDEQSAEVLGQWLERNGLAPHGQNRGTSSVVAAEALMHAIRRGFRYETRYAEGTQTPGETLRAGSGTCRDFAFLMMEAARQLGFAARFVTGYIYSAGTANVGGAATHAWAELFLPGLGWTDYDPTNALVNSPDLIKVAVVRKPSQALPVTGSFTGPAGIAAELHVDVRVERL